MRISQLEANFTENWNTAALQAILLPTSKQAAGASKRPNIGAEMAEDEGIPSVQSLTGGVVQISTLRWSIGSRKSILLLTLTQERDMLG